AVDHDILRRSSKGGEEGTDYGPAETMRRIAESEADKPRRDRKLRYQHPGAATAEDIRQNGHVETVDERRPGEFERISQSHIAHQPDLGARDARPTQPRGLRREDQQEGQP